MTPLQMTMEEVTPGQAAAYLETMEKNRKPRKNVIRRYAAEMARGRWCPTTGEAIKFDAEGHLIDGQHRLLGILEAETPVHMAVVRGASEDAQNFIDTGTPRRAADVFALHGIGNAVSAASIGRLVMMYDEAGLEGMTSPAVWPSNSELLEFATSNAELQDAAAFTEAPLMRGLMAKRIGGFLHYVFCGLDAEAGASFMAKLRDGEDLASRDPELKLRNVFITNRTRRRSKIPVKILLAYSFLAWNARREGRPAKMFKMPRKGAAWPTAA